MMKKLLVLVLVLGMASVASATLQISVDGIEEPEESTIVLEPSQTIIIDIWTDAEIGALTGVTYAMGVTTASGSLDWSGATFSNPPSTNQINGAWPGGELPPAPPGVAGFWGSLFALDAAVPSGTHMVDDIIFHCSEEYVDAYITLYVLDSQAGTATEVDSVTIHQVPEPMTVALLGLGGLFLLRRRK